VNYAYKRLIKKPISAEIYVVLIFLKQKVLLEVRDFQSCFKQWTVLKIIARIST